MWRWVLGIVGTVTVVVTGAVVATVWLAMVTKLHQQTEDSLAEYRRLLKFHEPELSFDYSGLEVTQHWLLPAVEIRDPYLVLKRKQKSYRYEAESLLVKGGFKQSSLVDVSLPEQIHFSVVNPEGKSLLYTIEGAQQIQLKLQRNEGVDFFDQYLLPANQQLEVMLKAKQGDQQAKVQRVYVLKTPKWRDIMPPFAARLEALSARIEERMQ